MSYSISDIKQNFLYNRNPIPNNFSNNITQLSNAKFSAENRLPDRKLDSKILLNKPDPLPLTQNNGKQEQLNKEKSLMNTIESLQKRFDQEKETFKHKIDSLTLENQQKNQEIQNLNKRILQIDAKNNENSNEMKKTEEIEESYKQKLAQFKKELSLIKSQQQTQKEESDKQNQILQRQLEEKKREINELKQRLMGLESPKNENFYSGQKNLINSESKKNPSASPMSFIKCNFDEFEDKIHNLLQENDRLTEKVNELTNIKDSQTGFRNFGVIDENHYKQENDDLKKNMNDLSSDNSVIKSKLMDLERKFTNLERDYQEKLLQKESELTKSYEKMLKELEEVKEKSIMKLSRENHELKQQNDDLSRQLNISRPSIKPSKVIEESKETFPKPINNSSSAILIINEMLTPSMKPQNNNNRENITGRPSIKNPLPQIPENQQEENSSFSNNDQRIKKPIISNVGLQGIGIPEKKTIANTTISINNNNSSNSLINNDNKNNQNAGLLRQSLLGVKNNNNSSIINKSNDIFKEKFLAKSYQNSGLQKITPTKDLKETNNSFKGQNQNEITIKSEQKECKNQDNLTGQGISRSDVKVNNSAGYNNYVSSLKAGNETYKAKETAIKDKKVIMFNLMDNHKKTPDITNPTHHYNNYISNK